MEKLVSDGGSTGTRGREERKGRREKARSLTVEVANRNAPEPFVVCTVWTICRMRPTVAARRILAIDHGVPREGFVYASRIHCIAKNPVAMCDRRDSVSQQTRKGCMSRGVKLTT